MDEASQYLRIPKSTLYKLCSKNEILYRKIGRYNMFTALDLDQFVNSKCVSTMTQDNKKLTDKLDLKLW